MNNVHTPQWFVLKSNVKYIFDYLLALEARYVLQGPVFTLTVSVDRATPAPASECSQRETRGGAGAQLAAQIATSSAAVLDIVTCPSTFVRNHGEGPY